MTDRELMQYALRALEASNAYDWSIVAALRERLAQPEQEPVALETVYDTIIRWDETDGKRSRRELARRIVALYTTPPRREWVGLTEGTITHIAAEQLLYEDMPYEQYEQALQAFARAIEAKLKEKNNG